MGVCGRFLLIFWSDDSESGLGGLQNFECRGNPSVNPRFSLFLFKFKHKQIILLSNVIVSSDYTVTTMMATTASNQEQFQRAYRRIRAVRTRPSTIAAQEFFEDPNDDWTTLPRRLKRLCQVLDDWVATPDEDGETLSCSLSEDPRESRRLAMTAAIFAKAPPLFLDNFSILFREALQLRQAQQDGEEHPVLQMEDEITLHESLQTLGWIRRDGKLHQPLGEALHETILSKVRETISGDYEDDTLFESVKEWKDTVVDPWVNDLVGSESYEAEAWSSRLDYCTSECFCTIRMDEIFDVVTDYPDSTPAVLELRDVLERTRMHNQLGKALRASLTRRLIHPGANTSQIIDVYINTIKVMREIDPSDRLLETVAEPVRSYLRGRADTVRCIITSLTDEEAGGDLYEELRRQDARPLEQAELDSDDEEEAPNFDWKPAPSITKVQRGTFGSDSRGNGGDILSMLVSIYGSKELFVNEYRLMLADKLLANLDFNTDKEVHTLELLKLRFGEMSMRQCEIMIKDTDDSKRIVSNIHSILKPKKKPLSAITRPTGVEDKTTPVDAIIVSHIFWPALQKEPLKHHPRIQAQLDQFSQEYAKLKNPRRLVWLNQLGTVQLELDVVEEGLDGVPVIETKEFSCSPLLATLISHFEDKEEWTSEELSNETSIAEHIIQSRMNYWINNRVIKASDAGDDTIAYELGSREYWLTAEVDPYSGAGSMMDEDGSEGAVSAGAQEEEEMEAYESYISGMLTTFGQLPLDQIHNKLKTFVAGSDHKYNKTARQLGVFLQHLCKQERLECGPDGMYKLVKKY